MIHDRYIVYTPQAEATAPAPAPDASRRSERHREMLDWLGLFDTSKATFTAVSEGRSPGASPVGEVDKEKWVPFVEHRQGKVLGPGTVLKVDHFPGLDKDLTTGKDPQPRIPGAPNYRALPAGESGEDKTIHGVGQPTIEGLRGVLDQVGAGPGGHGKTAVWTNLREEPVVYVNGRPLNLRLASKITSNLDNPGATGEEVERTEEQLKREILQEAARNGGRLLVHDETPDGRIIARWETITPESVQTTKEVFDVLRQEGYRVDYARIPITDEKSPEPKDFDALVERLKGTDPQAPAIFNCQAGRGRTTTATVVAGLLRRAQEGSGPHQSVTTSQPVREDIREQGQHKPSEYRTILGLIQALEMTPQNKATADEIIDRYASLQNLREAVDTWKRKADTALTPEERQAALQRAQDYLDRYHSIVAFDAYAEDQAGTGFQQPFSRWIQEHPEVDRSRDVLAQALGLAPTGAPAPAGA